jgi:hypothetical protein
MRTESPLEVTQGGAWLTAPERLHDLKAHLTALAAAAACT